MIIVRLRPPDHHHAGAIMDMLTHAQIWAALDRLAARAGLSPSGLAKRAGLDPTTFNKSKRITPDGRARWPSTESVAKSLNATAATVEQFVALITESAPPPARAVPLLGFTQASAAGCFDERGFPAATGWDEIAFPAIEDEHAYALEISGDAMEPAYRDGTVIVVSPAAPIRRNDRVVVKTRDGGIVAEELKRKTAKTVEFKSINPAHGERTLAAEDVVWIARIVWASQ
jgi:phage repressor protein C with HTH and peptisase S24 domain